MRKLFVWQIILSGVFVFECLGAGILRIPLWFLLSVYLGSMTESIGAAYLLKAFKKKWVKKRPE